MRNHNEQPTLPWTGNGPCVRSAPHGEGRHQVMMTREEMEGRRLAAAAALQAGVPQAQVARHFAVTRTTTCRWDKDLRAGRSLALRPITGRPPRVKWALIADLLRARPGGWLAERNVGESLAEAIEKAFGVRYAEEHALRIAKAVAPELFPRRRLGRTRPVVCRLEDFVGRGQRAQQAVIAAGALPTKAL